MYQGFDAVFINTFCPIFPYISISHIFRKKDRRQKMFLPPARKRMKFRLVNTVLLLLKILQHQTVNILYVFFGKNREAVNFSAAGTVAVTTGMCQVGNILRFGSEFLEVLRHPDGY